MLRFRAGLFRVEKKEGGLRQGGVGSGGGGLGGGSGGDGRVVQLLRSKHGWHRCHLRMKRVRREIARRLNDRLGAAASRGWSGATTPLRPLSAAGWGGVLP